MRKIVYSDRYECDIGPHVFPTQKYRLVVEQLLVGGHVARHQVLEPEPASRQIVERVHTAAYLEDLVNLRRTQRVLLSELPITSEIRDAAFLACGGSILAATHALADGSAMHIGGGFHHAMPDHAEGFCYLHDVAVALVHLLDSGRIERAAVIDTDVHQGNGTARIFQSDARVFTFSIHQENNYPIKEQSDWDIGLDDGTGDEAYLRLLDAAVNRILAKSQPDLVCMVAGVDPYGEDLLGGLSLSLAGLRARDRLVVSHCAAAGVPVVGFLAGGYARRPEDTVAAHVHTTLEVLSWNGAPVP